MRKNFVIINSDKLVMILVMIFTVFPAISQIPNDDLEAMRQRVLSDRAVMEVAISAERKTPALVVFKNETKPYATAEVPSLLRKYLDVRPGYDDFIRTKETPLFSSMQVPEYQQYFKGLKVEYSRYKALAKNNELYLLSGSFYEIPTSLSVHPAISEAMALQYAKQSINATTYAWEVVQEKIALTTDIRMKNMLEQELEEYLPTAELVIVKDFTQKDKADMRLAYKFNIYAAEPLSRGYVFVDAHTGKILLYNAIIKHASVPTTVTTRYAGSRQIYTKQVSGNDPANGLPLVSSHPLTEPTYIPGSSTYILVDDTRGNGIETYDLNNAGGLPLSIAALYAQAKSFTDVDNNWTLAEHKRSAVQDGAAEAENDDIAWDAHWGAEMVYDYWKLKHNRLSFDNKNATIKSYVHYGPAYDNAFWNGTAMTYGDGSGQPAGFKALTSLDVCGHEIGHGVCSFTSDLVYEKESGAMNEGFSDIWAACIENYVIKQIDPTLATRYKPFFIGEQISYSANALRRMDNPKLNTDPDTYGGQYWANPDCTPTLANDQCGVHTNSGVLNKWFYLLTVGSGAGSGPDAAYVIPGAEDGINDLGNPYVVAGMGFDVSEQLAYLTEILLSSTATYAEARAVSIAVASAYGGDPCGAIVQNVTNAWYAVGVGSAFTLPCTVTYGFLLTTTVSVPEGRNGFGCNGLDTLYVPVQLPANSTGTITTSGSATAGVDYILLDQSISNSSASGAQSLVRVVIINDGVVEDVETIVLNVAVTNTGTNSVNTSNTINIIDDDVVPVIGTDSITLLTENFESYPIGFDQPTGWIETLEIPEDPAVDPQVAGKNQWGVFANTSASNTTKALAITGRLNSAGLGTLPPATYYFNSPSQTRITPPQMDARGLNNIVIKFDYTVQGEVDPNGADPELFGKLDYMALAYSLDGVNYTEMGPGFRFASAVPVSATFSGTLPSVLNNKQFYLAFRWVNDALIGGPVSIAIDNLTLKAVPRKIETQVTHAGDERINGPQEVYFYSREDQEIIAKITTTGPHNYECVTTGLENAGTGTFDLYTDGSEVHKVGDRVIRITPAANNTTGSYSISLYLTEAEIQAIENATVQPRTALFIYKTSALNYTGATTTNTEKVAASYTPIPGNAGGVFTASFATGFSAFALGAPTTVPLPVNCLQFIGMESENRVTLSWRVSQEVDNKRYIIERSSDGINFDQVASVESVRGSNGNYSYNDYNVSYENVYYRLKQEDFSGATKFLCKVVHLKMDKGIFAIGNIYPNPIKGKAFVKITSPRNTRLHVEVVNSIGQVTSTTTEVIPAGTISLSINFRQASAGTYMVRFKDEEGNILSTQTIIQQ